MPIDLLGLIRCHHDDLDRALQALIDPRTSASETELLLDAFRIGFTAHAIAQIAALRNILRPLATRDVFTTVIRSIFAEHGEQARSLSALTAARPGTDAWDARALELRVLVRDHAAREELMRASIYDRVDADARRALASAYATERFRSIVRVDAVIARAPTAVWTFN